MEYRGDEEWFSEWLKAIVVVAFDVEHGQVVEQVCPTTALGESDLKRISYLSLPDSNSGQNGDVQFSFRVRQGEAPLHSMGPLGQAFLFCSVYFRQIRDETLARGYFQKSVVLVSHHPYASFLEECVRIIGPLFFEFGSDVLNAVSANIRSWEPPIPGVSYELPLAGSVIYYRVPWTGLPSDDILKETVMKEKRENEQSAAVASPNEHTGDSDLPKTPRRRTRSGSSGRAISTPIVARYRPQSAEARGERGRKDLFPDATDGDTESETTNNEKYTTGSDTCEEEDDDRGADIPDDQHGFHSFVQEHETSSEFVEANGYDNTIAHAKQQSSCDSASSVGNGTAKHGGENENKDPVPTLGHVFEAKAQECPGLFQDVPLFTTFGGLSVALWHIWELALIGESVLVLASTPDRCSKAVMAITSLVAPITYSGDYRPYFTIYDSDFHVMGKSHDQLRGQHMPATILGVTNPYFLKALEYWPNVVSMGGGSGPNGAPFKGEYGSGFLDGQVGAIRLRRSCQEPVKGMSSNQGMSVKGKNMKTAKYRPTIVRRGASLRALLSDQQYESSLILTRDEPLIPPDKNVLRQLMVHTPTEETRAAAAAAADAGEQWEAPAVAINNAILRQHFRKLTQCFLRPLERYFKLEAVGSRAARTNGLNLSAYNEAALFAEHFNEDAFLQLLETQPPAKMLRRGQWRELYRKFINGPNFPRWYNQKITQLNDQLATIYRHLRLHTDSETLIRSAKNSFESMNNKSNDDMEDQINRVSSPPKMSLPSPETYKTSAQSQGYRLYMRVKRALDLELSKPEHLRDIELCEKMEEHLNAVHNLIRSSSHT